MRDIITIVEADNLSLTAGNLVPPSERANADLYRAGYCHALALALSELTGLPMVALRVRRGRERFIAHIMVECGQDEFLDIDGVRGIGEIEIDCDVDPDEDQCTLDEIAPAEIARSRRLVRLTPAMKAQAHEDALAVLSHEGIEPIR